MPAPRSASTGRFTDILLGSDQNSGNSRAEWQVKPRGINPDGDTADYFGRGLHALHALLRRSGHWLSTTHYHQPLLSMPSSVTLNVALACGGVRVRPRRS
jgi:hypothetical protein